MLAGSCIVLDATEQLTKHEKLPHGCTEVPGRDGPWVERTFLQGRALVVAFYSRYNISTLFDLVLSVTCNNWVPFFMVAAPPHFCCGRCFCCRLIRGNYHAFYQPKCKEQFTLLAGSRKGILQLGRDEEAHGKDA